MAWAAVGYSEWQLNFVLPGYEERVQFYPKGSKLYLITTTSAPRTAMILGTTPTPRMVQIDPTRVKGETPKTNLVMVTREAVEVSRGEIKTPMQTKTRAVGMAVGVNTTSRRDTTLLPTLSQDRTKVRTLPTTAWLLLSTMMSLI